MEFQRTFALEKNRKTKLVMEKTQDLNLILSKLKKLQRLYEGAKAINSEAEAQNAATKIQNLLTQYNLSMADVESVADNEQKTDVIEERLGDNWQRKCGGSWDQLLLYGICKYNFCYVLISNTHVYRTNRNGREVWENRRRYIVIGEPQNIQVVKWLFDVLAANLYKLALKRYEEYRNDDTQAVMRLFVGEKKMHRGTFLRSYLAGAAKGVQQKLKEERDRELQAQVQVNALLLRTDKKLDDYLAEKYPKLGKARPEHIGSYQAMRQGMEDGRNVTISKAGLTAENTNLNQLAR